MARLGLSPVETIAFRPHQITSCTKPDSLVGRLLQLRPPRPTAAATLPARPRHRDGLHHITGGVRDRVSEVEMTDGRAD